MANEEEDELDRMMREINEQAAVDLESRGTDKKGNGERRRKRGSIQQSQSQQPLQLNAKQRRKEQEKLQVETLRAGIEKPLGVENRGFKLLSKFGYIGTGGLGAAGHGREEAIKIDPLDVVRGEKRGVGVKEETLRKEKELVERQKLTAEERVITERNFISNISGKFSQRALEKDIHRAQRVIQLLDEKADVARNELWPKEIKLVQTISDVDGSMDTGHGAIWVMGTHENDHGKGGYWQAEEVTEEQGKEQSGNGDEVLTADKLILCLEYLRTRYFYCLYCGCAYNDQEDLVKFCPGMTAEDH